MAKEFTPFYGPICGAADDLTPETAYQEVRGLDRFFDLLERTRSALELWPSPALLGGALPPREVADQKRLNRLANIAHDLAINATQAFGAFLGSRAADRCGRTDKRVANAELDGETHLTRESLLRIYSSFNGAELGQAQASATAASALLRQLEKEAAAIAARRTAEAEEALEPTEEPQSSPTPPDSLSQCKAVHKGDFAEYRCDRRAPHPRETHYSKELAFYWENKDAEGGRK